MNRFRFGLALLGLLPALALAVPPATADSPRSKTVDGIEIDWGLMSGAALARSGNTAERAMHGGVERGPREYHLTVSLTNTATGRQIRDARVEAEMFQIGLSGSWKPLPPMHIGTTVTYGNYFRMNEASPLPYRIVVRIRIPHRRGSITTELTHYHE